MIKIKFRISVNWLNLSPILETMSTMQDATTKASWTTSRNIFNISDKTLGCTILLVAAFLGSIDAIMLDVAEDDGVSANAMTLYASICTLTGAVVVDAYFWYVGYGDGCHVSTYTAHTLHYNLCLCSQ